MPTSTKSAAGMGVERGYGTKRAAWGSNPPVPDNPRPPARRRLHPGINSHHSISRAGVAAPEDQHDALTAELRRLAAPAGVEPAPLASHGNLRASARSSFTHKSATRTCFVEGCSILRCLWDSHPTALDRR